MSEVPVITVDGPSGAGKGTVSHLLAEQLGSFAGQATMRGDQREYGWPGAASLED